MLSDVASQSPTADAIYHQLYADHADAVLTYLTNKLRDPETAQDVASAAWENALRGLPRTLANGDGVNKSWVMRVATNAMYDHWRAVKARPQTSDLDTVLLPGTAFPAALMDEETPETALFSSLPSEESARVALLVEGLPHNERVVLWLCEYGRLNMDDIGATLGLTRAAIKARLWRARKLLGELVRADQAMAPGQQSLDRLWSFIDRRGPGACWPWYGARVRKAGQPAFSVLNDLNAGAARLLWAVQRGPLAPWALVRSACGDRSCVNLTHLRATVHSEQAQQHVDPRWLSGPLLGPIASGPALQAERQRLSLSQGELGALAGLSKNTVLAMEQSGRTAPRDRPRRKDGDEALVEQCVVSRLLVQAALQSVRDSRPSLAGTSLRARRLALGLTPAALARAVGTASNVLTALEQCSGRCGTAATRQRVANTLARLERELPSVTALPDGSAVRARRLALGLSQIELGAAIGYGHYFAERVVLRVEHDRGTLRMLPIRRRLLAALDRLERERQEEAA